MPAIRTKKAAYWGVFSSVINKYLTKKQQIKILTFKLCSAKILVISKEEYVMKFDCLKSCKALCFAAGALTVVVGKKIVKNPKTRELCVSGLAKGMQIKESACETLKNLKEDAEDICCDAKERMNAAEEAEENEA